MTALLDLKIKYMSIHQIEVIFEIRVPGNPGNHILVSTVGQIFDTLLVKSIFKMADGGHFGFNCQSSWI